MLMGCRILVTQPCALRREMAIALNAKREEAADYLS
jgi:hypothetical protein